MTSRSLSLCSLSVIDFHTVFGSRFPSLLEKQDEKSRLSPFFSKHIFILELAKSYVEEAKKRKFSVLHEGKKEPELLVNYFFRLSSGRVTKKQVT